MAGNEPGRELIVVKPNSYMEIMAINYVIRSGFYKLRLADFLEISYPTLERILKDQPDFFHKLKKAEAIFIQSLVANAAAKNPMDVLRTKYRVEFPTVLEQKVEVNPSEELKKIMEMIEAKTADEQIPSNSESIF